MTDAKVYKSPVGNAGQWIIYLSLRWGVLTGGIVALAAFMVLYLVVRAPVAISVAPMAVPVLSLLVGFVGLALGFNELRRNRPIQQRWVQDNYGSLFNQQQIDQLVEGEAVYVRDNGTTRDMVKFAKNPAGEGQVLEFVQVATPRYA